jgi:hypothetical protein
VDFDDDELLVGGGGEVGAVDPFEGRFRLVAGGGGGEVCPFVVLDAVNCAAFLCFLSIEIGSPGSR